jgi:drug/metabolite transporter (DMT)-like permease
MSWFVIAIISYLLLAIVNLTDKFLIDNVLKSSKTYTFLVCWLGGLAFLLAPWLLHYPGVIILGENILTGVLFAGALYFLYEALRRDKATRTVVLVGGFIPIFSTIIGWIFLGNHLLPGELLGLFFLLTGIFLFAFLKEHHSFWEKLWRSLKTEDYQKNSFILVILAAIFYAAYFSASKFVYSQQDFWSAFIWVRLGAVITVSFFLFEKKSRQEIVKIFQGGQKPKRHNKNVFLFLFNQGLGGLSFVLQNYAIFLGPVALVTALQGVQYAIMMFFSFFLGFFFKEFKEKITWRTIIQKTSALVCISIGLYLVAIYV